MECDSGGGVTAVVSNFQLQKEKILTRKENKRFSHIFQQKKKKNLIKSKIFTDFSFYAFHHTDSFSSKGAMILLTQLSCKQIFVMFLYVSSCLKDAISVVVTQKEGIELEYKSRQSNMKSRLEKERTLGRDTKEFLAATVMVQSWKTLKINPPGQSRR